MFHKGIIESMGQWGYISFVSIAFTIVIIVLNDHNDEQWRHIN